LQQQEDEQSSFSSTPLRGYQRQNEKNDEKTIKINGTRKLKTHSRRKKNVLQKPQVFFKKKNSF
jgi:hypothetical protein